MDLNKNPALAPPTPNVRYRSLCRSQSVKVERLLEGADQISGMLVCSAQFKNVLASITRFAPHKTSVLIQGESGTGKELVARALHNSGPVPNGPFVTFNCSNLIDSLAESQLFGHVKGAFTDAREESLGYFRSANGGTLFLDEIGELPLRLQPKLLRAVAAHEFQPVGSAQTHKVDIKLVCATSRDLQAMVKDGSFRADLYYRLNAAAIFIPPLRDRRSAIPAFVGHFIEHYNREFGKDIRCVAQSALDAICAHSWPGNIRELDHAVQSAVLLADGDEIGLCHLSLLGSDGSDELERAFSTMPTATRERTSPIAKEEAKGFSLAIALGAASREALLRALKATDGNCPLTARLLGISRYTVYRMISRHHLGAARDYHNWSAKERRAMQLDQSRNLINWRSISCLEDPTIFDKRRPLPATADGGTTMSPTALVIEDNSVVRKFIRLKLETSGWKVGEADNASAALRQFRQLRPHLVTLDLMMPINDGFDAMHLARLINDEAPEVALLVVSAVASKPDIKDFMRKHEVELFDKSPADPYLKNLFSRTNVLFHELSAQKLA